LAPDVLDDWKWVVESCRPFFPSEPAATPFADTHIASLYNWKAK
jgi:hypothetical protein